LSVEYGIPIKLVTFLPLGADVNTAVYRLSTPDHTEYFFKIRSGRFDETAVALPKYLSDRGIRQIIPPIPTTSGRLWGQLDDYKTIHFPFINGRNGYEVTLSDAHFAEFGLALKQIHSLDIPPEISGRIRREHYSAEGRQLVRESLDMVQTETYEDPTAQEMALTMQAERQVILDLIERTERLAEILQAQPPQMILCHTDIHAGNILIGEDGAFYIVDWDEVTMAPKERDLMYPGSGLLASKRSPEEEERLFYQAYGPTTINSAAIAYYRYERIIQDLFEYCKHLLLSDEGGEDRAQSLYYFKSNFLPNATIDIAYQMDKTYKR
jgi:spectinomycin phosphotransferase